MTSSLHPATWVHLDWVLVVVLAWLLIGVLGVLALRRFRLVAMVLFPLGVVFSLLLLGVALSAVFSGPETAILPLGLPQLPFHLRLDSLSAFFLILIGGVSAGVSAFAAGYFRQGEGTPPGLICLEYHVFLASIAMVVLADDAYVFMVAWETMAFHPSFWCWSTTAFQKSATPATSTC
jgi:formate hydrogenlyase subunit 3/multisubunit Na+/H+ antiporter MnhD subunit